MTELREVFEMTTKQVEPDLDSWREQVERQRGARRNRRIGALVVGGAIGIVLVTAVIWTAGGRTGSKPTQPGGGSEEPQADTTAPVSAVGPVPETDYLLDLDTGQMTPLPTSIAGSSTSIAGSGYAASPDGGTLAYSAPGDNGESQIFIANLDGTGIEQVTHDPEPASSPAWSPDGSHIAYIRGGQSGADLRDVFVVDLATGMSTQLTFGTWDPDPAEADFGPWKFSLPSFTPDGSAIVYNASRGDNIDTGEVEVRMVPVGGGESVLLMRDRSTDGTNAFDAAQLSPDGSLLSYTCGEYVSICVANTDGTGEQELGRSQGDALNGGDWSPDGARIAYFAFHAQDVSIVDVTTGDVSYVAEGSWATWLDDHTLIIEIPHCYNPATGQWGFGEIPGCNKG